MTAGKSGGNGQQPRPFPMKLGRRILVATGMQNKWPQGWATDGKKNMYAPSAFLGTDPDKVYEYATRVQYEAPDGAQVDKTYKVGLVQLVALK